MGNVLQLAKEVQKKRRKFLKTSSDEDYKLLADALHELAKAALEHDEPTIALYAAKESLTMYRQLSRSQPDVHLSHIATSCIDLSRIFSELEQQEDAVTATQEAIDIYLQLANHNPAVFTPKLVASFNYLENLLSPQILHKYGLVSASTKETIINTIPRQPARGGFPPQPRHGFHGRARELLTLERLFAQRRIVVLHGFGGQGKTALATHAAAWLVRTGLFQRAVFLSVEQGGGLELALSELGHALVGEDFNIRQGDPVDVVAAALARTPTLVVWDNFESILPGGDATLPAEDLKALLDAGAYWAKQGESRLLVTTRDTSFGHDAFAPGKDTAHLPLGGLAVPEALELAGQILADRSIDRPPRSRLEDLLSFLGGHPLSLQLVLPHLADPSIRGDVEKLIAEFERLLPGFVEGKAAERNESLTLSLDFSLRRLNNATRSLLPGLGVFQGGAIEFMIFGAEGMKILPNMNETVWREVRAELGRASLLTSEEVPGVTVPFIKFHPTLAPYLAAKLSREERAALEERYRRAYHQLATFLYFNDNKDPIPTRAIVTRELPNLRKTLDLHLAAGDVDAAVDLANSIAYFFDVFGRWRERDVLLARVRESMRARERERVGKRGALTKAEFTLASRQGETLWSQGRTKEAEQVFRALLQRMDAGADYDTGYDHCLTLGNLGRSLRAQGHNHEAEKVYRQTLAALAELEQTEQVRRLTGSLHTDLADVLRDQGGYDAARAEYEMGLDIAKSQNDTRQVAVVQGQLGTLALMNKKWAEARHRYQQALASFHALGEDQSEAILWHQLGMVAQKEENWDEAERCYRQSLTISERIGDKAQAASTCNNLAVVEKDAGRPAQAERWYRRAIELNKETKNAKLLASNYNNLADLLLTRYDSPHGPRPDLDAAEEYALRAVAILERLDLSAEPWKTYSILAKIAERKGNVAKARAWRRKEQETFAAFPGSWARLQRQFGPVVDLVVAATQGVPGKKEEVERLFEQLTRGGYMLEEPIRRIWAGERDVWALTEGLDRADALIVRKILAALAGEDVSAASPSPAPSSPQSQQEEGMSMEQLLALVVAACQGDAQARLLANALVQGLQQPNAPAEYQALGAALARLLAGERDRNQILAGLPAELGGFVDVVLAQVG